MVHSSITRCTQRAALCISAEGAFGWTILTSRLPQCGHSMVLKTCIPKGIPPRKNTTGIISPGTVVCRYSWTPKKHFTPTDMKPPINRQTIWVGVPSETLTTGYVFHQIENSIHAPVLSAGCAAQTPKGIGLLELQLLA